MREQKEQEKQNELLRVVAEQNHERLIEYDVKEDRAVVYAIENDRFLLIRKIKRYFAERCMHACKKKGLLRSMSVIAKKKINRNGTVFIW